MNEELPNSSQSTEEVTAVRGQYDHLFDPVPEPVVTEQEINSWPELQDYQRKWYAPVSAEAGQEARTGKGDGGRQPTPETEAEARDNISRLHDEK